MVTYPFERACAVRPKVNLGKYLRPSDFTSFNCSYSILVLIIVHLLRCLLEIHKHISKKKKHKLD